MYIKVLATTTSELVASDQPLVKYFDFCKHDFKTSEEAIEYMQDWFMENTPKPEIYDFYRSQGRKPIIEFLDTDAEPLLEEDNILLPHRLMSQRQIHPDVFEYAQMNEEEVMLIGLYYAFFEPSENRFKDLELARDRLVYKHESVMLDEDEFIERQVKEGELPSLKANATEEEKKEYDKLIRKLIKERYKEINFLWFRA